FYLASNFGGNWQFDFPIEKDEASGNWTYPVEVNNNGSDYYFTFFTQRVGEFENSINYRWGAKSKDLEPEFGQAYELAAKTEDCFKISKDKTGTYTISISENGGYVTFTKVDDVVDPDLDPTPDPDPDPTLGNVYTYYFDNSQSNWSEVYAYAWNGNNLYFGGWPGEKLDQNENGLYVATIKKEGVNASGLQIIFNNNSGKQTADLPACDGYTYTSSTQPGDVSGGGGGESGGDQQKPDPLYSSVGQISGYDEQGQDVVFYGENATITLTPYADNVVKVFTLVNGAQNTEERKSITVVREPEADYTVKQIGSDYAVEVNGTLAVIVNGETGRLSFQDYTTKDTKNYTSEATSLINNHNNRSVAFESTGTPAALYGGGYNGQQESVLGRYMEMNNTQAGGWHDGTPGSRCINIPFVVSTDGYGILFDDHYRGGVIESSDNRISYKSGANDPISYYFVGGGSLDEVVANYTNLTGRQDLPPYWALGYITSRYGYHSFTEGRDVIDAIRGAKIPLDGIVYDLYWQGQERELGRLTWDTANFPNPAETLASWKDMGIHTTLITEPFFTVYSNGNYDYLKEKGYLADDDVDRDKIFWLTRDGVGLIDASNPEALDWMWTFYKDRTNEGVDGWWLDLGEPEQHDGDSKHMGGSVSQVHNEFGNLWVERVYRGLREEFPKMRPFIMPRAGTSGMQRFSTF
ncbi:MAG: starch-binding protein, partial [Muribaculaceae bacterium]|nr:starch-binding protein [Muribaculaceae bacterium]